MHAYAKALRSGLEKLALIEEWLGHQNVRAVGEELAPSAPTGPMRIIHWVERDSRRLEWCIYFYRDLEGPTVECQVRLHLGPFEQDPMIQILFDPQTCEWKTHHVRIERSKEAAALLRGIPEGTITEGTAYKLVDAMAGKLLPGPQRQASALAIAG